MLNSQLPMPERFKLAIRAAGFYATWYPKQWLSPFASVSGAGIDPVLSQHLRFAADSSRRLARVIFHAMARHGPKLERQQLLLGRFVDIGAEIFAIASSCARAQSALATDKKVDPDLLALADYFSRTARLRIERLFYSARHNVDRRGYRLDSIANVFAWRMSSDDVRAFEIPQDLLKTDSCECFLLIS